MITTNDKIFFNNAQKLRDGWPIGYSIRKKINLHLEVSKTNFLIQEIITLVLGKL